MYQSFTSIYLCPREHARMHTYANTCMLTFIARDVDRVVCTVRYGTQSCHRTHGLLTHVRLWTVLHRSLASPLDSPIHPMFMPECASRQYAHTCVCVRRQKPHTAYRAPHTSTYTYTDEVGCIHAAMQPSNSHATEQESKKAIKQQ